MMLTKVLTKSGRKILKTIKKISTGRLAKKLQQLQQQQQKQQQQQQQQQQQEQNANGFFQMKFYKYDGASMVSSSSLPSLDAKSVDTFVTYVGEGGLLADGFCYVPHCCCHCDEREENQRNENLENEMMR